MTRHRPSPALVLGALALVVAAVAATFATTGVGEARNAAVRASPTPKKGAVLRLGRDARFAASAVPTVERARTTLRLGRLRAQDVRLGCPSGTADLGTWCLDRGVRGTADFAGASRACVRLGGRLPTAGMLIGAAPKLRLSGRLDDRPSMAFIDPAGRRDLRELSSSLFTTTTGSAASGSATNPAPSTLQYATVFDNGNAGGFAGGVPSGSPERFRCAFLERQPTAPKR
ncbi:hypothetical protein [Patulibacter minatonensis]|uniref:hypothetical protein n=1 Tax=Patulibacter minatonensis TaxID=298163 RepID=UPI00047DCCB5|nr:hypothetical protein [Patulibacter minatonensis]